jgi:hypothetical protein
MRKRRDPELLILLLLLLGLLATGGCGGSEGSILDLRTAPACYTLLNTKGAVGCRSPSPGGATAPVALIDAQAQILTSPVHSGLE